MFCQTRRRKLINTILLTLSLISINAKADLTNYKSNNVDFVYSSFSDVSWTKDSNLLGSLIEASIDDDNNGVKDIIDAIIAASPTISSTPSYLDSFTGSYTISKSDFSSNGGASWFGALAFVNYLNFISYGGTNEWYLPTNKVSNDFTPLGEINGTSKGGEFGELHAAEYEAQGFTDLSNYFDNLIKTNNSGGFSYGGVYWYGSEVSPLFLDSAFAYLFIDVRDVNLILSEKSQQFYVWAVSPGIVATVPENSRSLLLILGIGIIFFLSKPHKYLVA